MKTYRSFPCIALAALLAGCAPPPPQNIQAAEITGSTYCSLDGMRLGDYPGPKAQIVYTDGKRDFFCDTIEMFSVFFGAGQKQRIAALFVQDMTHADWRKPATRWIDADRAIYVSGSDRRGSMGATLVPFANEEGARMFTAAHGGKVLHFAEVTPDMAALDGGALHDTAM